MISLKSSREIEGMAKAGKILAGMHIALRDIIKPGITSWDIEKFSLKYIEDHDATPEEKGFEGYKYATCVSINDEVAHTMPRKGLLLKDGDVVAVDTVVNWHGYLADSCWTFACGDLSPQRQALMDDTLKALYLGIQQAVVGNRVGDIGDAIDSYVTAKGYGNVKALIGHGIQPTMHENPDVPAYGEAGRGPRLKAGMTICIEPMITTGSSDIVAKQDPGDDWEFYVTDDGSDCAQFEHTIAITEDGPRILTSQDAEMDAKYLAM